MAHNGTETLPPAGRTESGAVLFYGWAPDPDSDGRYTGKQRLSLHTRDRAKRIATDTMLDVRFDTHEEAEAWVTDKNMAARS